MGLVSFIMVTFLYLTGSSVQPQLYNPYTFFGYNPYYYNPSVYLSNNDPILPYLSTSNSLPTLNVLAKIPFAVSNKFKVVPMLVVTQENVNLINENKAHLIGFSNEKPLITIKVNGKNSLDCALAVEITLEHPISVYSLKTNILFPSEVEVSHENLKIPIKIGAVIVPVSKNTFISPETPISVLSVYALSTQPIDIDEAIVVDGNEEFLPSPNITIIEFPDKEAEPVLQVDEEDDELINRNPPIVLAPAGIVQSTQPHLHVQVFTNSKESPVLVALREEAKKKKKRV